MKVWVGYGSEHSTRLVMIGQFTSVEQAKVTEENFRRLRDVAENDLPDRSWEEPDERLPEKLRLVLDEMRLYEFTRYDVENFAYEHDVEREGDKVRLTTEEADVQGFLKLMIHAGAKLEVFSRHHWSEDGPVGNEAEDSSAGVGD